MAGLPGRYGHVQVPEDGAGEGGLRPQSGGTPALLPGRTAEGLRAADAGNLRFRRVGENQNLGETSSIAHNRHEFVPFFEDQLFYSGFLIITAFHSWI